MRASIPIVLASVGLLVGMAFWFQEPALEVPPPAEEAMTNERVPGAPALAMARAGVDATAPTAATCSVRGRVVDSRGAVVPGAEVAIATTKHRQRSGADGCFELVHVDANANATIEVAHPGMATLVRPVTLWPSARVDVGDLVLHAQARVRGTVLSEDGVPVANAKVLAGGRVCTSGDDGSFEMAGLTAGRHLLRAAAEGFAGRSAVAVELTAGETRGSVELWLDRARVLSGRVVTQHGRAVAGAAIEARLDKATAPKTSVSGDDGRFEVRPLPRGKVQLTVTHPMFVPFGRVYSTYLAGDSAGARGLSISLTETRAVLGRVLDAATGAEIAITRVQLLVSSETERGPWRSLGEPFTPHPDDAAAGCFRLPFGNHTMARVVAWSASHAPALSEPFWKGNESEHPLVLRARPGVRLHGVLRDDRGQPVPGARVEVVSHVGEGEPIQTGAPLGLATQRSDGAGTFSSTPIAPGRYRVRVRRPGYRHVDVDIEIGVDPPQPLQVVVDRAGTIRGCVPQRPGKAQRLRVTAIRLDPETDGALSTPTARLPSALVRDGAFVLEALTPGRYRVQLVGLARGRTQASLAAVVEVRVGRESFVEFGSFGSD